MTTHLINSKVIQCHHWKIYIDNNYETGYSLVDNFSKESVDILTLPIVKELKRELIEEGKTVFEGLLK